MQVTTPEVEAAKRAGLTPVYRHILVREGCTRMTDALADPAVPLMVSSRCPFVIEALATAKVDKTHDGEYAKDGYYEHASTPCATCSCTSTSAPSSTTSCPKPSYGAAIGRRKPGVVTMPTDRYNWKSQPTPATFVAPSRPTSTASAMTCQGLAPDGSAAIPPSASSPSRGCPWAAGGTSSCEALILCDFHVVATS